MTRPLVDVVIDFMRQHDLLTAFAVVFFWLMFLAVIVGTFTPQEKPNE